FSLCGSKKVLTRFPAMSKMGVKSCARTSARARAVREEGRTPREGAGSLSGPPANSTAATTIPRASRTPTRFIPVLYRRFRAGIQDEADDHLPASNFLNSV